MSNNRWDDDLNDDITLEPDDDWWASVLANEPDMNTEDSYPESGLIDPVNQVKPIPVMDWSRIKSVQKADKITCVCVDGFNRGGLLVSNNWVKGFIPASHLVNLPSCCEEDQREPYFVDYLDRSVNVKIIECDKLRERVVFSERAALAGEGRRKRILNSVCENDIVEGTVTNITSFGVFVDLGGIEGLIHLSELSWGRVNNPGEIVKTGDKIRACVLQVSVENERIALSLKRLNPNPWEKIKERYSDIDSIPAVITSVVKYGAFARLPDGLEGLIHVTSINLPQGMSLEEYLKEGHDVLVKIVHLEPEKRRLGLSLQQRIY